MLFFGNKIKFKKESQSLGLNLNDKHIKRSKNHLQQLKKHHEQVQEDLKKNKMLFDEYQSHLLNQYRELTEQEKLHKQRKIKLEIRRDQLKAKDNPTMYDEKAKILKTYLKCMAYTVGDRFEIIKSMNKVSIYERVQTKVLNLEFRIYNKSRMKEVVYMKKISFEDQLIMLVVKELPSAKKDSKNKQSQTQLQQRHYNGSSNSSFNKPISSFASIHSKQNKGERESSDRMFEVRVYAVTGEAFEIVKVYSQKQFNDFYNQLNKEKPEKSVLKTPLSKMVNARRQRFSLEFSSAFANGLANFMNQSGASEKHINSTDKKINNIEELINKKKAENSIIHEVDKIDENSIDAGREEQSENSVQTPSDIQHEKNKMTYKSIRSKQTLKSKANCAQEGHSESELSQDQQKQSQSKARCSPNDSDVIYGDSAFLRQDSKANNEEDSVNMSNANSNTIDLDSSMASKNGLIRSFYKGQKTLFPDKNPILNLVILKKQKSLNFLPQYLRKAQNHEKIQLCVRKYQLKIKLQQRLKKSLMYKVLTLDTFFESSINDTEVSVKPLRLLFYIKSAENDVYVPNHSEISQNIKSNKEQHFHEYLKQGGKNVVEKSVYEVQSYKNNDIVLTCENIKCEDEKFTFLVQNIIKHEAVAELSNKVHYMIEHSQNANISNRIKTRNPDSKRKHKNSNHQVGNDRQPKNSLPRESDLKQKKRRRKNSVKEYNDQMLKEQELTEEQKLKTETLELFDQFFKEHLFSLRGYRFLKVINFEEHLDKVVTVQKNLKMFYYKGQYKKMKKFPITFKYKQESKVLVTALHDTNQNKIKVFVECTVLLTNQKYRAFPAIYHEKYWSTISGALQNVKKMAHSVIEIQDYLDKYFSKKIKLYELELARLEALKPELYLNRIRRFFINIMLRGKARKNILFIKKLQYNAESFVLIIRKSPLVSTLCHVNLYHLQELPERNESKQNIGEDMEFPTLSQNVINLQNKANRQKMSKYQFQTITLQSKYIELMPHQKIVDEFYFDENHFLLKPSKSEEIYFIERLVALDINCEEITKELTLIELQQPSQKNKMMVLKDSQNLTNQSDTKKTTLKMQPKGPKLRKRNASILIERDSEGDQSEQPTLNSHNTSTKKTLFQEPVARSSFRISIRNSSIMMQQRQKENQSKNEITSIRSKMSFQRLSKNSFLDIVNNECKKGQIMVRGNGHGKMLYYSLLKNESVFYELRFYIVRRKYIRLVHEFEKSNLKGRKNRNFEEEAQIPAAHIEETIKRKRFNDELQIIHKEHLSKKELMEANWNIIYQKIARWLKNNISLCVSIEEGQNSHLKDKLLEVDQTRPY